MLNAQHLDDASDSQAQGEAIIADVTDQAGIADLDYDRKVVVGDDIEDALLNAVAAYDTVCSGATRSGAVSQALFGSIPETISEEVDATVAMGRGPKNTTRSVREALIDRLHSSWVGSRHSVRQWIASFVHYYNFQRPHQALDERTPVEEEN